MASKIQSKSKRSARKVHERKVHESYAVHGEITSVRISANLLNQWMVFYQHHHHFPKFLSLKNNFYVNELVLIYFYGNPNLKEAVKIFYEKSCMFHEHIDGKGVHVNYSQTRFQQYIESFQQLICQRFLPEYFSKYDFFNMVPLFSLELLNVFRKKFSPKDILIVFDVILAFIYGEDCEILCVSEEEVQDFNRLIAYLKERTAFSTAEDCPTLIPITVQDYFVSHHLLDNCLDDEKKMYVLNINPRAFSRNNQSFLSPTLPKDAVVSPDKFGAQFIRFMITLAQKIEAELVHEVQYAQKYTVTMNDETPCIFALTPDLYFDFIEFFFLHRNRIPKILRYLGGLNYVRFAVPYELISVPIHPFFTAAFHVYFHTIPIPNQISRREGLKEESKGKQAKRGKKAKNPKTDDGAKVSKTELELYRTRCANLGHLLKRENPSYEYMGVIGTPKEAKQDSHIINIHDGARRIMGYFGLDWTDLEFEKDMSVCRKHNSSGSFIITPQEYEPLVSHLKKRGQIEREFAFNTWKELSSNPTNFPFPELCSKWEGTINRRYRECYSNWPKDQVDDFFNFKRARLPFIPQPKIDTVKKEYEEFRDSRIQMKKQREELLNQPLLERIQELVSDIIDTEFKEYIPEKTSIWNHIETGYWDYIRHVNDIIPDRFAYTFSAALLAKRIEKSIIKFVKQKCKNDNFQTGGFKREVREYQKHMTEIELKDICREKPPIPYGIRNTPHFFL